MQQQPKEIVHFEGQKVVAIAAGDEFSIIIDDRGYPWGWGRAEQGQVCCTVRDILLYFFVFFIIFWMRVFNIAIFLPVNLDFKGKQAVNLRALFSIFIEKRLQEGDLNPKTYFCILHNFLVPQYFWMDEQMHFCILHNFLVGIFSTTIFLYG